MIKKTLTWNVLTGYFIQMAGCQVACSFYHRLSLEISRDAFSSVRLPPSMNRSSVVHITAGKFKWPRSQMSPTSPVVYVVIQEYPDRKWRQIAQVEKKQVYACRSPAFIIT